MLIPLDQGQQQWEWYIMSAEKPECIQCLRKIITRIKAFIQMTPKIFFLLPQKYTNKMGEL